MTLDKEAPKDTVFNCSQLAKAFLLMVSTAGREIVLIDEQPSKASLFIVLTCIATKEVMPVQPLKAFFPMVVTWLKSTLVICVLLMASPLPQLSSPPSSCV